MYSINYTTCPYIFKKYTRTLNNHNVIMSYLEGIHVFSWSSTLLVKICYNRWEALEGVIGPCVWCVCHYCLQKVYTPPWGVIWTVTTCHKKSTVRISNREKEILQNKLEYCIHNAQEDRKGKKILNRQNANSLLITLSALVKHINNNYFMWVSDSIPMCFILITLVIVYHSIVYTWIDMPDREC